MMAKAGDQLPIVKFAQQSQGAAGQRAAAESGHQRAQPAARATLRRAACQGLALLQKLIQKLSGAHTSRSLRIERFL